MSFDQLARRRYSCRMLSDRPVEDEKIARILELCRLAPTAHNNQPFRVIDVSSEAGKKAVRESTSSHFQAPRFLVVAGVDDESWQRGHDGHKTTYEDAAIVGCHIMFGLLDLGLETTWVAAFDPVKLAEGLDMADDLTPIAIFPIGYPAADARPSPRHSERRALEELVIER